MTLVLSMSVKAQMYYSCVHDDTSEDIYLSMNKKSLVEKEEIEKYSGWTQFLNKKWVVSGRALVKLTGSDGDASKLYIEVLPKEVEYKDGLVTLWCQIDQYGDGKYSEDYYSLKIERTENYTFQEWGCWKSMNKKPGSSYSPSSRSSAYTTSPKQKRTTTTPRTSTSSRRYIRGPRGGCYYLTASGKKQYVDRSLCN